jgi:hypothetical protein
MTATSIAITIFAMIALQLLIDWADRRSRRQ